MSKDLKRPSNNHPDGSLPKHRKSDEVDIIEIENVNDVTPQGSFIKLKTSTLCSRYPNDIEKMIEEDEETIIVLMRPLFSNMMELLTTCSRKRIIRGPPGCGKSTSLYQIAQYCKLADWIVFYLPDCIVLMFDTNSQEANDSCEKILNYVLDVNRLIFEKAKVPYMDITFEEFIDTGIREKNCQCCLLNLITKLCVYKGSSKVLFAFDSWNKLLHKEPAPNSIAKTIAYWNDFTVNNGIAFFSTTSSFMKDSGQVKLQVFPGATAENQSNFLCVKPFDKSETEIFWNYMKSKFPNPNAYVNDLTFDQIFKLTGCVPRHIKNLYMDKYDMETCNTFDQLLKTLEDTFKTYYRD